MTLSLFHRLCSIAALAIIASFWLATILSELVLGTNEVITVKTTIPYGFLILIPALIGAGLSGVRLARGRRGGAISAKLRRMPVIALNGIFVLMPSALALAWLARQGSLDQTFYAVQAVELLAGAVNLTLLGLNARDGLKMTAGRRRRRIA